MRIRHLVTAIVALAGATPAAAQKTQDEARLMFTVGLTYTWGTDLWAVSGQPILHAPPASGSDTVDLSRSIGGAPGLVFSGMYFPKPAFGLVGEAFFMGIGLKDQCQPSSPFPTERTQEICNSIDGASNRSSAVLLSVGGVARIGGNQTFSPYARGQVGLLFSNLSPIAMSGATVVTDSLGTSEILSAVIYEDPSTTRVTPAFVLGGGVTAVLGKGWQLRVEARDNIVEIATVGGPTPAGNTNPEIINQWKNLFSIMIGADVVLEKKRGHRY
jgi:hypothetical protein